MSDLEVSLTPVSSDDIPARAKRSGKWQEVAKQLDDVFADVPEGKGIEINQDLSMDKKEAKRTADCLRNSIRALELNEKYIVEQRKNKVFVELR